jgi:hypothetical protein
MRNAAGHLSGGKEEATGCRATLHLGRREVTPELTLILAILLGAVIVALITLSYLDRRG